ncbi:MAG: hypothetical protein JWN41_3 [Thermoleophilia bacterium]|nr:hypothetical protein [Thermoleophilia bacterium]
MTAAATTWISLWAIRRFRNGAHTPVRKRAERTLLAAATTDAAMSRFRW